MRLEIKTTDQVKAYIPTQEAQYLANRVIRNMLDQGHDPTQGQYRESYILHPDRPTISVVVWQEGDTITALVALDTELEKREATL